MTASMIDMEARSCPAAFGRHFLLWAKCSLGGNAPTSDVFSHR